MKTLIFTFFIFCSSNLISQPWNNVIYDWNGYQVSVIQTSNINDIAKATYLNNMPVIYIHPLLFNFSWQAQYFIFCHEAAHHILGHVFRGNVNSMESEADCWAVRYLRDCGYFNSIDDINLAVTPIINSPGDWTHAPGLTRYQLILDCANTYY